MTARRKILIASDAWHPQVSGVVRTLDTTIHLLTDMGHTVRLIEPGMFANYPCPFYPEIRIAWPTTKRLYRILSDFAPDSIHIPTEATIGLWVRSYCLERGLAFTTSYHTKIPEYLSRMIWFPESASYSYLRWFHSKASTVMVATPSIEQELKAKRFRNRFARWSRGVNLDLFYPRPRTYPAEHRPVQTYVGRVSTEKGLEDFLNLKTPGKKYVVGDGPARAMLQAQFPDAVFLGKLSGEPLAEAFANSDVFVFPSKTDTFGLVILEALACGVPVAAYPAPGPIDILTDDRVGAMDDDLGKAVELALQRGQSEACVALARQYTWERCTEQFLSNLVPVRDAAVSSDLAYRMAK